MNKNLLVFTIILIIAIFPITSSAQFACGDSINDTRDGQLYPTVQIGTQCWMASNLNYGTSVPTGSGGNVQTNNGIAEKFCWDDDDDYCDGTNGKDLKGGFYEWEEAVQYWSGQPSTPTQGLCPTGWHIPTQAEFNTLVTELGGTAVAGAKMKVGGISGFNALLTGYRCTMNGGYLPSPTTSTYISYFWTSQQSGSDAYFYELNETNSAFGNGAYSPFYKTLGLSVRCIQDATSDVEETPAEDVDPLAIEKIIYDKSILRFSVNSLEQGTYKAEVYTIEGKLLKSEDIDLNIGANSLILDLGDIKSSVYLIRVFNDDTMAQGKFIVANPS